MSKNEEPEWEIVDSLPNERKPKKKPLKPKLSWKFIVGAGIGLAIAIVFPRFVINLVRNLIAYWWLILAFGAYWFIRRRARR